MTFLAIIIAVLLLQAKGAGERVHYDGWFDSWRARVASWGLGGGLGLLLAVLVPAVVVQLLLNVMEPLLFGLLWLLSAISLLLYSFGRGDFQATMAQYRGYAYAGDFEAAYLAAREKLGWEDSGESPNTALEVHATLQRALLYEGFQRWFTVMFYFVLLGPAAALVYRLSQLCKEDAEFGLAARWLFLLDWVPARLLAVTFAMTGDFIRSRENLLAALRNTDTAADTMLYSVGVAALGAEVSGLSGEGAAYGPEAAAQNREFESLLSRSAVCWVVVLSLLVLLF